MSKKKRGLQSPATPPRVPAAPKTPAAPGEVILEARNLTKSFLSGGETLTVLRELSLSVRLGESLAILGDSGSGKSTLLYLLGGLDRPTGGEVISGGEDVFKLSEPKRARWRASKVGFVFQFHHLLPEFDALENVAMPLRLAGVAPEEAREKALPLLERVGLSQRISHRPGLLSGGEQQRVALARALVQEPQILLADEPTGNLDRKNAQMVNSLILELVREKALAAVVVTHNAELARLLGENLTLSGGALA
ncbi:MAG: ABC transporter ATP-binding protein [Deltaproteobacteria bacterium]|jgi:lipoprotein-releasing system ATP-binding protein|nr:ABC transporter ATP-binding protein [Deltaproteobacteria bacterium]